MIACLSPNGASRYVADKKLRQLFVGTLDGVVVLRSAASGDEWQTDEVSLRGIHVGSLVYEPQRGGLFAGAHSGGLFVSRDMGASWERASGALRDAHVYTVAVQSRRGGPIIYAGTEPARLYRSFDYGRSWEETPSLRSVPGIESWTFPSPPHTAHVKNIAFPTTDGDDIYVAVEQGALLKSPDRGATWEEIDSYCSPDDAAYKDIHRIVIPDSDPDELYLTGGEGLYHSTDAGGSWEHLQTRADRIGYPDALLISPRNERILFMAGARANPGTWRRSREAVPAVARSGDGGRSWELVLDGAIQGHGRANFEAMTLYGDASSFQLFVGTTDGEVLMSSDEGDGWERIASGLAPVSKGGHYRNLRNAVEA